MDGDTPRHRAAPQDAPPPGAPGFGGAVPPPRFRLLRLPGLLPWAALFVPLSILAVVGWWTWRDVWRDAEADVIRAAQSAAEYGERTLESYGQAAARVNDRLRGLTDAQIRANEASLRLELQGIVGELSQSELTYVIDRDGFTLLASNLFPAPRGAALTDRDYFQALSGPAPPDIHISKTFIGRFDGKLLFSVSRRRADSGNPPSPDGFDGVVLVSISPTVLADGMRRLLPAATDQMALKRTDGNAISTTGGLLDTGEPLPRVTAGSLFYDFAAAGARSGVYISETAIPGSGALLAMRLINGFPIYAVALRPRAEIVARWRSLMTPQLAFGLPATLGLLLLSLRVQRDQRRLTARNAALRRANDLSSDRLERAKRFGLVGTFEFDPRTGISRRSPEYMSVQGLPPVASAESHDDWASRLHPDDKARAESELARALSDAGGDSDYAQTYRIVTPGGEIRWIAARGEILRDDAGIAVMLLGAHVDVTPLRSTEMALAESDARLRLAQEAVGIGVWEWRGGWSLTCSRKMLELLGFDPGRAAPSLRAILSRLHRDDRGLLRDLMAQIERDGGFSGEFRVLRPRPVGEPELVWVAGRAKRAASPQIAGPGLMGVVYDITERKRAEEMATAMAHEVEHRAKNALAVVSSLLRLTKAESADELAKVMEGRVRALSQAMSLLGRGGWQGADLREIVESELKPFERAAPGGGFEIDLCGPPVLIGADAAQALSMTLHELATNAAKYGALSKPGGGLRIDWRVEAGRAHLRWRETGGPRLDGPPQRAGFGSKLITMVFERQIGGVVDRTWAPEGLVCDLSFPLAP